MHEIALRDGSWLCFDAFRAYQRSPRSGTVSDLSWAPTWWLMDLLQAEKVGGLTLASEEGRRLQELLDQRTHKPFGVVRSLVPQPRLLEYLERALRQLQPRRERSDRADLDSLSVLDAEGRRRPRFTVRTLSEDLGGSELVLHDCASRINAPAVVALATAQASAWANGRPSPRWVVSAINRDQVEVTGRLGLDAAESRLVTEHLCVVQDDLNVCGGEWITSAVVPPELLNRARVVINF